MAIYGGMVKPNMLPKRWAWYFQAHASHLAVVPQPAPQLPAVDYEPFLTMPLEELPAAFEQQAEALQAALAQTGPMPQVPEPQFIQIIPGEPQ